MSPPYRTPATTKRVWRNLGGSPVGFAGVEPDIGAQLRAVPAGVERLLLVGPRPGAGTIAGLRSWVAPELVPAPWQPGEHYLRTVAPVLRFRRPGQRLEVSRAAAWFQEGDYTTDEALEAWRILEHAVGELFGGARLVGSPASTGRHLLERSVAPGHEWPTLPDDVQELVRSTSGQGRIELLEPASSDLEALVELDGRLMYGALCWGMPGPLERHDVGRRLAYEGKRPARYRVDARIPDDWHGRFGLLGVRAGEHRVDFPRRPGQRLACWCEGSELELALEMGWSIDIREKMLFERYSTRGPLDTWAKKLCGLYRGLLDGAAAREHPLPARLAARGVRSMLLHAIGSFRGNPQEVTGSVHVDRADELPDDATDLRLDGDYFVWSETRDSRWRAMSHPEWCACIWGRARARLLHGPGDAGALHCNPFDVVAFRTDALYLTYAPNWPDDGRAGAFRVKSTSSAPSSWPRTQAQLLELRDREVA